jgi:predicted dehydrogenase
MAKVRIGFVGVGFMGQMAHLKNYVGMEDCEVAAIAELRKDTARLVAQRYGIAKVYASHREMLAEEKLDGVVASQPFTRHAVLLPEIYPHVKHVFTEKPLAVAVSAGEKLAAAARQAGCVHMVGYHKLSDPAVAYARKLIEEWKASGTVGKLRYVRILMPAGDWIAGGGEGVLNAGDKPGQLQTEPPAPDLDKPAYDAYVSFVNYYIHQVNLMRHLLGEPYSLSYADKSGVLLAVRSQSGVAGVIEMSPYQTSIEWEESALVCFERGYIHIRLPAPLATHRCGRVEVYSDPGKGGGSKGQGLPLEASAVPQRSSPTLPWVHAMRQQAVNFVNVCKGEQPPPCDAQEAVEDLRIAREYVRLRYGK